MADTEQKLKIQQRPTEEQPVENSKTVDITVDFGGGMEVLFSYKRSHDIKLPYEDGKPTIRHLIKWLLDNLLSDKSRPELFSQGDTVRPGILVLINDTDWELEGELDYEIQNGDNIMFISTLHGG